MRFIMAACACAVLTMIGIARAASPSTVTGPREKITFGYTTSTPGSPTGLTYDVWIHNPHGGSAAPVPVRKMVVIAPVGSRVNRMILPRCTASDMRFEVRGERACPPRSKIASGTTVTRPLGGSPYTSHVSGFNTPNGMAILIKFGQGGAAVVRVVTHGRRSVTLVPTCLTGGQPPHGCPKDEDAVVSSVLRYPRTMAGGRSYFMTPSTCPPSGRWVTRFSYTYADGVTDRLRVAQPCRSG